MYFDKEYNKKLIEKYPFLMPHNRWTDEIPKNFDYSYTELDAMPTGWRTAFGEQMCEELKEALGEHLDKYRIMQIKEKYGGLRWYSNFETERSNEVIHKYVELSYSICINCGAPATKVSTGWICPWCEECAKSINDRVIPIEEFYNQ